jgi:hypothetical protein
MIGSDITTIGIGLLLFYCQMFLFESPNKKRVLHIGMAFDTQPYNPYIALGSRRNTESLTRYYVFSMFLYKNID